MSKRVAVVLAGCGFKDGAEIHEAVLVLLRLSQLGANVQCFAPDVPQQDVVNHLTGNIVTSESRNVLTEAARIARGNIKAITAARAEDFDALIVPGGFGAAKNLCSFALKGSELTVQADFLRFAKAMQHAGKPIGLVCIAPVMAAAIFGKGVKATIGDDAQTVAAINATGAVHAACAVDDICIDRTHKLVTTPAFMLAQSSSEAFLGIAKLVDAVLDMS